MPVSSPKEWGRRLRSVFLGPNTTFRNAHRNWLYFGFLLAVVVLVALARRATI